MWLARNKYGFLYMFDERPIYDDSLDKVTNKPLDLWTSKSNKINIGDFDRKAYPFIEFDNSPVEMKLIPKEIYEDIKKIIKFFDKIRINNE